VSTPAIVSWRSAVRTSCLVFGFVIVTAHAHAQALITPSSTDAIPAPPAAAPAPPRSNDIPTPVYRTGVDLVALNVVVTDAKQRFVTGLDAADFCVYEDGVQQDVSFFAATKVPLDLALLVDTSASMADKMETMQHAARGFLATLREGDRAAIVDIKDNVKMAYPLGGDFAAADRAIETTVARGGTALYNGLYLAIKEMSKQRNSGEVRRQAIAVFSDGEDTASLVGYEDVMELAKQSGIAVYTITLKSQFSLRQANMTGRRYFSQSEFAMRSLAQETGARSFFPVHINELASVYGSIAEELANQYAIGYSSKNPRRDGAFRRVIVRVVERPDARTRTRSGYQATRLTASR
jgi:Ca-activated chloride channel homolog